MGFVGCQINVELRIDEFLMRNENAQIDLMLKWIHQEQTAVCTGSQDFARSQNLRISLTFFKVPIQ